MLRFKLSIHNGFYVERRNIRGGLALFWRDKVNLRVASYSKGYIDTIINLAGDNYIWRITEFYGNTVVQQQKHSWQLLKRLATNCNFPWICLGDFNEIMDLKENWGGNEISVSQINSSKQAIDEAGLIDLGYSLNRFTWSKGREIEQRICERLDRTLANTVWCSNFPNNIVSYLNILYLDHIPIMVFTEGLI